MNRDLPQNFTNDLAGLPTQVATAAAGALVAITDAHALTQTQRERLKSAYDAIGSHLAEHKKFNSITMEVHPQGSMLIGTTTRPEGKAEFDVDLVLSLVPGLHEKVNCKSLLDAAHEALTEHANKHDLAIHRKCRCIQLQYADEMHADITPVILHPQTYGLHCDTMGLVPDRELQRYLATNPKGYGKWFDTSAALMPEFSLRRTMDIVAKADVIPLPSQAVFNRLLSRIVQLFKIHRNAYFSASTDLSPPSVFITTLIVHAYRDAIGEKFETPMDLMFYIWRNMPRYIQFQPGYEHYWILENPTASGDNLADRMNTVPARKKAFENWHMQFYQDLTGLIKQLSAKGGVDALAKNVTLAYGPVAGRSINTAVLASTEAQRASGRVIVPKGVGIASGLAATPSIAMPSRPHNFFGRP